MNKSFNKIFSVLSIAAVALASCSEPAQQEEVISNENYYGSVIETTDIVSFEDVKNQLTENGEVEARIQGEVLGTCAKKGCWMEAATGEDTLFVKFKNYEFFVPTEGVEGYNTVLEGKAYYDTTTVAELKHYAEDAGLSQEEIDLITEPEYSINFTATGVMMEPGSDSDTNESH